jgi:hypothetical protein
MLESNSGAPAEAMDGAARIALLERELELLRRRDAERSAELAARERRIRLLEEALSKSREAPRRPRPDGAVQRSGDDRGVERGPRRRGAPQSHAAA